MTSLNPIRPENRASAREATAPLSIVSMSLGVVTSVWDMLLSDQELVKQADTALYRAKKYGRNRVEVFHGGMSMGKQADRPCCRSVQG